MTEHAPRGLLDGLFRSFEMMRDEDISFDEALDRWREANNPEPPSNVIHVGKSASNEPRPTVRR
jgi:hypothetical protein